MEKYLSVKNINKYFGDFQALKNVNFDVKEGEFVEETAAGWTHDAGDVDDHRVVHVDEECDFFIARERAQIHRLKLRGGVDVLRELWRTIHPGVVHVRAVGGEEFVVQGRYPSAQVAGDVTRGSPVRSPPAPPRVDTPRGQLRPPRGYARVVGEPEQRGTPGVSAVSAVEPVPS